MIWIFYICGIIRIFARFGSIPAEGFVNEFMEEFSPDAFDNRRQYITSFYQQNRENLDRAYPYLTKEEMDAFVENCWQSILTALKEQYGLSCCW